MAKRGRKSGIGRSAAGPAVDAAAPAGKRGRTAGNGPPMSDYRHAATRKNNPPTKIAAEGTVPVIPKAQYAYDPHLPPVLRFDQTGQADAFETRLSAAAEARADRLGKNRRACRVTDSGWFRNAMTT